MTGEAPGTPGAPPGSRVQRTYAIIGTGAVGIYYGGLLHNAGFPVTFVSTRRQPGRPGPPPGSRFFSIQGGSGDIVISNPRMVSRADDAGLHDVAIITLKTTQNHLLREILPRVLTPGGTVIFLQNGIGVEEEALAVVAAEQILIGMCYIGVEKIAPDRVRHVDGGRIVLGALNQRSEIRGQRSVMRDGDRAAQKAATGGRAEGTFSQRLLDIASDFQHAGIPIQTTDDILRAQWQKLLWNIPFNGLSVVLDMLPHEIAAERHQGIEARRHEGGELPSPLGRGAGGEGVSITELGFVSDSPVKLVETIMREVLAAARATGHPLSESLIPQLINYTRTLPPFRTSMRMDFERGRELELKTMYENSIRLARSHGIEMPATEWVLLQLRQRSLPGISA